MDRQLRGSAAIVLRVTVVVVAVMLVTSVATGWLYWLRAGVGRWPGPKVGDALPLDELPGHDGDRLTAGLTLAAGTGVWLLVVDAFCLLVVRQVPAGAALHAAARLQPVYLAAVLAGTGGALLTRGDRPCGLRPG